MSILIAKPDGSSDAKVGDTVITGGGVFLKTATGSQLVSDLTNLIGKKTTKSYSDVVNAYSKMTGGGADTTNIGTVKAVEGVKPEPVGTVKFDENGVGTVGGFDASSYVPKTSTKGSTIVGYIVLSLVGIALLDRFMNK